MYFYKNVNSDFLRLENEIYTLGLGTSYNVYERVNFVTYNILYKLRTFHFSYVYIFL